MKTVYNYYNNEDEMVVNIEVKIDNPKFALESPNKIFPIDYSFLVMSETDGISKVVESHGSINSIKELNDAIKEIKDLIDGKRYKTMVRVKGYRNYSENNNPINKRVDIGIISDSILLADREGCGKYYYVVKDKDVVQTMLSSILKHLKMIADEC